MDFDKLLDDVLALLAERGRVSYAALKQYFSLDDDQLAAVREELVYARQLASDESDRVLVALHEERATDAQQAERRHLTVMFVDMVGSSDLASKLDPEDLRELVRTYQLTVSSAIARYHGYIAQYLGDGVLIYFGYPHAHEDDPRRAVFAARDILKAIDNSNQRLERTHGVRLVVRIGVHTGLVVVGDVGSGESREALALGKTPNVAARLEGIAEPGTIVVSGHTRDLLQDMFETTPLGERELKGIPGRIAAYRVDATSGVTSPIDIAVKHKLLPLAGRRGELAQLIGLWERALHGEGSQILIRGRAGIGKSRLAQALREHLTEGDNRWTVLRTSPYHTNTPLYPIVSFWQNTVGISDTDSPEQNLATLEASLAPFRLDHGEAVAAFARLLNIELPAHRRRADVQLRDAFRVTENVIEQILEQGPRLLLLEDMQWADPSTIEMTRGLISLSRRHAFLFVMTARPEFDVDTLGVDGILEVDLGPLQRADVEQMITSVAGGRTTTANVYAEIMRRTGGVPAFVEELTRMLVGSEWLKDDHGHLVPDGPMPETVPETLKDSLMARLDKLGEAKTLAQQAAVVGRAFSRRLIDRVTDLPGDHVATALEALVEADVLKESRVRSDAVYVFRHVLLQQAAYDSVLRSVRQSMHARVADVMEAEFRETVDRQPERVAEHLTQAGEYERAIGYWQWAGESAVERGAYVEARVYLERGLDLLSKIPESPLRDQRELSLLNAIGPALVLTGGWAAPALGKIYSRVMTLLGTGAESQPVDYQILGGLTAYHLQRAEFSTVHALAGRLLRQASTQQSVMPRTAASICLAAATFFEGRFAESREHCNTVVTQTLPPEAFETVSFLYGQDPIVIAFSLLAFGEWMTANPRASIRDHRRGVDRALTLDNEFSLALAKVWYARMQFETGDYQGAMENVEFVVELGRRRDYAFAVAMADMIGGACEVHGGDAESGLSRLRNGLAVWRAGGNVLSLTYYLELLASAELAAGHRDAARESITEGLAVADEHGEHFWRAELYRRRACTLEADAPDEALEWARRALDASRDTGAVILALRAAHTLARVSGETTELAALASNLGEIPDDGVATGVREMLA